MYDIYLKDVKEFVEKRVAQGPVLESNYISSTLKNRRLELSMTLSDVTKDICSEAFLSKLERNLMNGKNERVAMLCDRLNLNYQRLMNIEDGNLMTELLSFYFNENYDKLISMNEKVEKDFFIAQDQIILTYVSFLKEDYRTFHKAIIELDAVKECLCDLELYCLFLILFDYNMKIMKLSVAKEYLNYMKMLKIENLLTTLITTEREFILSSKLEDSNVDECYQKLKKYYEQGYPIRKQFLMMVYYMRTKHEESSLGILEDMKKDYLPECYEKEYFHTYLYLLIALKKYDKVVNMVDNNVIRSYEAFSLYAYALYNLKILNMNDEQFIEERKKKLEEWVTTSKHSGLDGYHYAFLRLMMYELDQMEPQFICNYLKNYWFKEFGNYHYPPYQKYCNRRYCELLGQLSRYKDAYLFLLSCKKDLQYF